MWRWLEERDVDIVVPNRVAHNGSGLSLDGFLEARLYPRRTTNYFAIPRERRMEIRDRARAVLGLAATSIGARRKRGTALSTSQPPLMP